MPLSQTPACGTRLLFRRGDLLDVHLAVDDGASGEAWLRTNIGRAAVQRREIIEQTDADRPPLARDWHDLPMMRVGAGRFRLRLPLLETGVFEAKAFLAGTSGKALWPSGGNVRLRVLPAHTVCANTIYNAFPRQFGPATLGRSLTTAAERHAVDVLDGRGYAVIPPSGTFRDLARRLDVILGQMGFRFLQLLPVHPVPTTFARLGRYGSPFAVQDFYGVDPGMAEFDRMATPMAQFEELLEAAHRRGAHVLLDLPANHTGWASWLQLHHPEWFRRSADGSFVSPGAWGVVWEDLCQLDVDNRGLWRYLADVFLHWCRKGVDGFRCDAGYMVPQAAWRYIVARTREEFPDTVFFLEGLGGPVETTAALLGEAGLDWAYSEMFQSLTAPAMRSCLDLSLRLSRECGTPVHFAETHDNNRLAATSKAFSRFRCALSALLSHEGAFGIANGVEWYAAEKIDVHGSSPLNWGARENQVDALRQVNRLLRDHPAFHAGAHLEPVAVEPADCVGLCRRPSDGPALLVLANPDAHSARRVSWPTALAPDLRGPLRDRLSGQAVVLGERGDRRSCELAPLTVLCLEALGSLRPTASTPFSAPPEAVQRQQYRALVLEAQALRHGGLGDVDDAAIAGWIEALRQDPRAFLQSLYGPDAYVPCTVWQADRDQRRVVPVPPGHMLLVQASQPFLAELRSGDRCHHRNRSLPAASGGSFTLMVPCLEPFPVGLCELHLQIHSRPSRQVVAPLRVLAELTRPRVRLAVESARLAPPDLGALCSSDSGSMAQVRARWGSIQSQYDALFAANAHPDHPVDRTVLFTRCRAWIVHRDYSQEVGVPCQTGFRADLGQRARWDFMVPVGMGRQIPLTITLEMATSGQGIGLQVQRAAGRTIAEALDDAVPVTLILRPDLESRGCHQATRALDGPETAFPKAVQAMADGFVFAPAEPRLVCRLDGGRFVSEPEWQYRVPYPVEQSRGLAEAGDLFSPGYFACELVGGQAVTLSAGTTPAPVPPEPPAAPAAWPAEVPFEAALRRALRQFLVRRDGAWTVLAGYPWFLDWGRDTLIVLRGVIAAGRLDEARAILRLFARFEHGGSLPNMIHGDDVGNRDTSDAPFWLSVAVDDYRRAVGRDDILDDDCGGRSLRQVLADLAKAVWRGTDHGVRVDAETGLVFSPAHFTWMDTNHPAATPREGFPIEIQALWYKSLRLLDDIGAPGAPWGEWASKVRAAVVELYARGAGGGLCDCLHGAPGTRARQAEADDACRPNQLLAVTLGLIDDRQRARQVVEACGPLVVPGGLRSLADTPVTRPLAVRHRGKLLNDPQRPYWGRYEGDEDTRRKPAYHNGTAWSWLYPSFAEAMVSAWGPSARPSARGLLEAMIPVMEAGCLGQLPEIIDGDAPHRQRGCPAQAWGASELLRVLLALDES